jgi:inosose dehydratase
VTLRAGSAPVSFGIYGQPIETIPELPDRMLDAVAEAGYAGCELGPAGFLGTPEETASRFASRGLTAVGAYAAVHFAASDNVVADDLTRIERTCRELGACGGGLVILADEGSDVLLTNPARPWDDRSLALDDDGWRRLGALAERAVELARDRGLGVSFHPHISTYVESPWEIERLLELTTVGLTIDTGHLQLAGGDPVECLRAWRDRVNHVHLKDVRLRVLDDARSRGLTDFDAWWGDVCVPFGTGDVDLSGFLGELVAGGYDGWLVVEQDRTPLATLDDLRAAATEQRGNLEWLDRQLPVTHV